MPDFECDCCGACCNGHLIVEAYDLDVWREPKLASANLGKHWAELTQQELMAELEQEGKCLIIACGDDHPYQEARPDLRK